jgi:predicted signal transduction protein with EAL and GGDEF domain
VEALLRWFHPEKGAISPAQFIPVAERSGFVDEMVKVWAPDNWKSGHKDLREEAVSNTKEEQHGAGTR